MTLGLDDFVVVLASYNAKSAQIASIAEQLNLGLDAFVFVDDNPIELAEVSAQLAGVQCLQFPSRDEELPSFFRELAGLFAKREITEEDRQRTDLYRARLASMAPSDATGADLTTFLRDLEMRLVVHDRTIGDRTRAVQLINKTNQFNLNGRRITDDEVAAILSAGGRLFGATLSDRNGSQGEILSCLIDSAGMIRAFVMSCRVFQRRVEHAFLAWLAENGPPIGLDFTETPRNEPIRQFMQDPAFIMTDTVVTFDAPTFAARHRGDLSLFALTAP